MAKFETEAKNALDNMNTINDNIKNVFAKVCYRRPEELKVE